MGSKSDWPIMQEAQKILAEFGIETEADAYFFKFNIKLNAIIGTPRILRIVKVLWISLL